MGLELADQLRDLEQGHPEVEPSDFDSISDMATYPTPSSVSSESIVAGSGRVLSKQDSGILVSPEEAVKYPPGGAMSSDNDEGEGRVKLTGAPLDHEHGLPLRSSSPVSLRSDDTDLLVGEYTRHLARQEDATESDAGSEATALLMSGTELAIPDSVNIMAASNLDSTMTLMSSEGHPVQTESKLATTAIVTPGYTLEIPQGSSEMQLDAREVVSTLERPSSLTQPLLDTHTVMQISPESGLGTPSPTKVCSAAMSGMDREGVTAMTLAHPGDVEVADSECTEALLEPMDEVDTPRSMIVATPRSQQVNF